MKVKVKLKMTLEKEFVLNSEHYDQENGEEASVDNMIKFEKDFMENYPYEAFDNLCDGGKITAEVVVLE